MGRQWLSLQNEENGGYSREHKHAYLPGVMRMGVRGVHLNA